MSGTLTRSTIRGRCRLASAQPLRVFEPARWERDSVAMADHLEATLTLPSDPASVSAARRYVAGVLADGACRRRRGRRHDPAHRLRARHQRRAAHLRPVAHLHRGRPAGEREEELRIGVTDSHPRWPKRLPAAVQQDNGRGMVIIRWLAAECGGRLSVAPTADGGKTVWIALPWTAAGPEREAVRTGPGARTSGGGGGGVRAASGPMAHHPPRSAPGRGPWCVGARQSATAGARDTAPGRRPGGRASSRPHPPVPDAWLQIRSRRTTAPVLGECQIFRSRRRSPRGTRWPPNGRTPGPRPCGAEARDVPGAVVLLLGGAGQLAARLLERVERQPRAVEPVRSRGAELVGRSLLRRGHVERLGGGRRHRLGRGAGCQQASPHTASVRAGRCRAAGQPDDGTCVCAVMRNPSSNRLRRMTCRVRTGEDARPRERLHPEGRPASAVPKYLGPPLLPVHSCRPVVRNGGRTRRPPGPPRRGGGGLSSQGSSRTDCRYFVTETALCQGAHDWRVRLDRSRSASAEMEGRRAVYQHGRIRFSTCAGP